MESDIKRQHCLPLTYAWPDTTTITTQILQALKQMEYDNNEH